MISHLVCQVLRRDAQLGCGMGGFDTGMSATDHHYVEIFLTGD